MRGLGSVGKDKSVYSVVCSVIWAVHIYSLSERCSSTCMGKIALFHLCHWKGDGVSVESISQLCWRWVKKKK